MPRGRRPGGGPSTREEILRSTRALVAERGVERTSIRAIASGAGVDPALIYHYFATKEELMMTALAPPVDLEELLVGVDADPSCIGEELVRRVLTLWESEPEIRGAVLAVLRAAVSTDDAVATVRDVLAARILEPLGRLVAPEERELRSALVGAQVMGLLLARYVVRVPAIAAAPREDLVRTVGPVIQRYLTG